MANSIQEKIVHLLSQRVFGRQALFFPSVYERSREPADLAWVINRCAVLFYMTAGNQSFEKKVVHNLKQMGGWLKVWSAGTELAGEVDHVARSYSFSDVDHIIVLSVVDSKMDGKLVVHHDHVKLHASRKLTICLTVTEDIIKTMSSGMCFPLDLVTIVEWMSNSGYTELPENVVISKWNEKAASEIQNISKNLKESSPQLSDLAINSSQASEAMMRAIKEKDADVDSEILHDLKQADFIKIALSFVYMDSSLALPGQYGRQMSKCSWRSGQYNLLCVSTTSITYLVKQGPVPLCAEPGITILRFHDAGIAHPAHIFTFLPRAGKSELELALDTFKAKQSVV